ncbi:MAG TPA: potassium-transporting ATPase subunit KdpA, partial [Patescibacteria group bacterium]|nr:potassium-transporting ATPase subunit KdpA [Patescibacteria group bacterium]
MLSNSIIQVVAFFLLFTAISVPLGLYMAKVFSNQRTFLDPVLGPIERLIYRVCGINPGVEMGWAGYTIAMLSFSLISMIFLYALQRLQYYLPLNPQGLPGVPPGLAFNTAASFTTNTNWQAYSGEQTLSYLTQMVGLTSHNFLSAAAGIAMAAAVIRGFARRSAKTLGNFWV